jgi:hypothetical protein
MNNSRLRRDENQVEDDDRSPIRVLSIEEVPSSESQAASSRQYRVCFEVEGRECSRQFTCDYSEGMHSIHWTPGEPILPGRTANARVVAALVEVVEAFHGKQSVEPPPGGSL